MPGAGGSLIPLSPILLPNQALIPLPHPHSSFSSSQSVGLLWRMIPPLRRFHEAAQSALRLARQAVAQHASRRRSGARRHERRASRRTDASHRRRGSSAAEFFLRAATGAWRSRSASRHGGGGGGGAAARSEPHELSRCARRGVPVRRARSGFAIVRRARGGGCAKLAQKSSSYTTATHGFAPHRLGSPARPLGPRNSPPTPAGGRPRPPARAGGADGRVCRAGGPCGDGGGRRRARARRRGATIGAGGGARFVRSHAGRARRATEEQLRNGARARGGGASAAA